MLPQIQTPQRPEGTPSGRGTRSKMSSIKSSSSLRKTGSSLSQIQNSESSIKALLREEALFRCALEAQCSCEQNDIALMLGEEENMARNTMLRDHAAKLQQLVEASAAQQEHNADVSKNVEKLTQDTATISKQLEEYAQLQRSEERKELVRLTMENGILKRDLDEAKQEVERRVAECQALRDTLSRRLIRTSAENEIMRNAVRDEVKKNEVNLAEMETRLRERIDSAVLDFHKPTYESSLRSLQELAKESRDRLQAQAQSLHSIIGAIGAKDSVDEAKSMHSNLPSLYRKQLRLQNKEQLLNLVDVLSFEDGIVECIGRALYALDLTKTQHVFN